MAMACNGNIRIVRAVAGESLIRWPISGQYRCFESPAFGESVSWPGMPECCGEFS